MRSCLLFALLATGACGTTPDERKPTFEVVTLEVLKPTCGQVQCHSTTTAAQRYAFDTVEAAHETFKNELTVGDLSDVIHTDGANRMPPDYPLEPQDIDLVDAWIAAGAPGSK